MFGCVSYSAGAWCGLTWRWRVGSEYVIYMELELEVGRGLVTCSFELLELIQTTIIQRSTFCHHQQIRSSNTYTSKMKATTTLSAFIAAIELAQATVYLAGDSTMAKSGANDGVTDGQSATSFPYSSPLTLLTQAGAPTLNPTSSTAPPS